MYREVKELLSDDAPTPLGNYVRLPHYVDKNLFHDQLTGYYVTGILNLVNKTPTCRKWYYPTTVIFHISSFFCIKVQNSPFFLLFFFQARFSLYFFTGSETISISWSRRIIEHKKCKILNSTLGPVSCGNYLFWIIGFLACVYLRWYLVATICPYNHRKKVPYTLRILPGSDGLSNIQGRRYLWEIFRPPLTAGP